MKKIKYNQEHDQRIDKFLSTELNISRNKVIYLIKNLKIRINNNWVEKSGEIISNGDEISILESKKKNEMKSINKDLDIIYEDKNYLIVNKPSGLLVHHSSFNEEDTLANRIKYYFEQNNILFDKSDFRWGICHRLDKDTSGLIIVAKNIENQKIIMDLIKNKKINREYIALINGSLENKKIKVDVPIKRSKKGKLKMITSKDYDAKDAITYFESLIKYDNFSLIKCKLETGRTHQIRVHLLYLKNPIINDRVYGNNKFYNKNGQYLHANKIEFNDPFKNEIRIIESPMPKEFSRFIEENK